MKKYFLFVLFSSALSASAQITLEHKYDSASALGNIANNNNQLMIIKFEISG